QTFSETLKLEAEMSQFLLEELNAGNGMTHCLAMATSGLSSDPGTLRWEGLLQAANNGDYSLYLTTADAVKLWVGDDPQPVIDAPAIALPPGQPAPERKSRTVTLKAGQLYAVRLEFQAAVANTPELRWSSATTPKEPVPPRLLYPNEVVQRFIESYTLLHKIAMIINGFKLTAREVAYFSTHALDFAHFDPRSLPLSVPTDQQAAEVFAWWQRLADYTGVRKSLPSA